MRIISLVPSLTDAVAQMGRADDLVAVTEWCSSGAPAAAARIGGTKNPSLSQIVALRPDVVLANTEENKPESLTALRDAGVRVEEFFPRTVDQAITMTRRVGEIVDAAPSAGRLADEMQSALDSAEWPSDRERVMALTLVWRKPWMGLGPATYADDLLWNCGFANVLSGFEQSYPTLDPGLALGEDVVLLPSEPYAFGPADSEAVGAFSGSGSALEFVDGQALTWHGPRTADALRTFGALARDLHHRLQ